MSTSVRACFADMSDGGVAAHHLRQVDRVFIATLIIAFFAIALLLVTIYPSPTHLLRLY